MAIARIALDVPLETLFDYRTGDFAPVPGQLVVVPFGRRRDVGVVAELAERSEIADARLRRIERILPLDPLPADLLALIRFWASTTITLSVRHCFLLCRRLSGAPATANRVGNGSMRSPAPGASYVLIVFRPRRR
jgi:primosomal protein N'